MHPHLLFLFLSYHAVCICVCLSAAGVDLELEGIRYLQWPLGYFREAHLQCAPIFSSGPLAVHDSALGSGSAGTQHLSCILH